MKKGVKAQTGVIVIVIIVLIVLILGVVLVNIFIPMIRERTGEVKTGLLSVNLNVKEIILFVTGSSRVIIERGSGTGEFDSLKFVFSDDKGLAHVEEVKNNLGELETRTYYFSPFPDIGKIKSISVYPVFGKSIGREFKLGIGKILEIPGGLVSWWRFNENFEDFLGLNKCTNEGSVNIIDDNGKRTASFDSGFLNCGNNQILNLNKDFAFSFWIKTSDNKGILIKKGANGNENYKISLNNQGKIEFSYKGSEESSVSEDSINDGKWHYVLITNQAMYIDGNTDSILNIDKNIEINDKEFIIGEDFNGFISELMIFNRSLSIIEQESMYKSQI